MRTLNDLKRFGKAYADMTEEQINQTFDVPEVYEEKDPVLSSIFAPDPVTGVPASDIHFMLAKDKSPELAQYIRDILQSPRQSSSLGTDSDSADVALKTVKTHSMSRDEYINNLKSICVYEHK